MEDIKVLVIVINYNQSRVTLDCIDSISKSEFENLKILVVDNGSKDEEFELLKRRLNSEVIIERIDANCGYVGGVNHGLLKGYDLNPKYFLIMNNDTIIDRSAIKFLVDSAQRFDQKVIVSGKVYHFDQPNTIQYTGSYFTDKRYLLEVYPGKDEIDRGQCDIEEERDMLDDIFWLVPKRIVNDIGYYSDNYFLYKEQADYAMMAVNKGYKLIYSPKAKLWHKGSLTTGDGDRFSPPVNFWRMKSSVIFMYRNLEKKYFFRIVSKRFLKIIVKNVLNYLHFRDGANKKIDYAALIGYIYGFKWIWNPKPDNGYNPFVK